MSTTVELIKQDHRKVEQLFKQFRETQDPDIADQLCVELTVHTRLEEELLYPRLRAEVDAKEAQHAQEEHDEAKQIIQQIQNGDATGRQLTDLVTKLEDAVTHHVKEEETEVLPDMEKKIGPELETMFDEVVQRKSQLMEEEQQDPEMLDLAKEELKSQVEAIKSH